MLDTRTQRAFPASAAGERVAAASLLGPNTLNRQVTQRVKTKQLTFVVSPAPVFGHSWVEEAVQFDVVQRANRQVKMARDYEAWSFEQIQKNPAISVQILRRSNRPANGLS